MSDQRAAVASLSEEKKIDRIIGLQAELERLQQECAEQFKSAKDDFIEAAFNAALTGLCSRPTNDIDAELLVTSARTIAFTAWKATQAKG